MNWRVVALNAKGQRETEVNGNPMELGPTDFTPEFTSAASQTGQPFSGLHIGRETTPFIRNPSFELVGVEMKRDACFVGAGMPGQITDRFFEGTRKRNRGGDIVEQSHRTRRLPPIEPDIGFRRQRFRIFPQFLEQFVPS